MIFVGDDWAEKHHDLVVVDAKGAELGYRRVEVSAEGLAEFHDLVGGLVDNPSEVIVGIETDRGRWVESLVAAGYRVYPINPKTASSYRDRDHLSGAKSDRADARVLADAVRVDHHKMRPVAADTAEVEAIKVLARAHQNLVWDRTRHLNRLRRSLLDYFPAAVETFDNLGHRDAVAVLSVAASPTEAARLTPGRIRTLLRNAGRQRNIDTRAAHIREHLGTGGHLEVPPAIDDALAATTRSTMALIAALNDQIAALGDELSAHFEQHPDAGIYLSLPGLGVTLGARVLGEFGDDPNRFATGKSRKNYAGTSPITKASGKNSVVVARWVRNNRLADACDRWAQSAITASPGARAFYDHHRRRGLSHHKALRTLANRLVGILHGCIKTGTLYNEDTAWAHRNDNPLQLAA